MSQAFMFFDPENKTQITFNDFCVAVQGLRVTLSKDEAEWVYNYLDCDNDGKINYQEFCWIQPDFWRGLSKMDVLEQRSRS